MIKIMLFALKAENEGSSLLAFFGGSRRLAFDCLGV
jgi:hypothetical protein